MAMFFNRADARVGLADGRSHGLRRVRGAPRFSAPSLTEPILDVVAAGFTRHGCAEGLCVSVFEDLSK